MRLQLMKKLTDISSFIYEEMTDYAKDDADIGRDFWKYLKAKTLDDSAKKIKVSDYVYDVILKLDSAKFNEKYRCRLDSVKKSRQQMDFCCTCVSTLLHYSPYGSKIIDWS